MSNIQNHIGSLVYNVVSVSTELKTASQKVISPPYHPLGLIFHSNPLQLPELFLADSLAPVSAIHVQCFQVSPSARWSLCKLSRKLR